MIINDTDHLRDLLNTIPGVKAISLGTSLSGIEVEMSGPMGRGALGALSVHLAQAYGRGWPIVVREVAEPVNGVDPKDQWPQGKVWTDSRALNLVLTRLDEARSRGWR